MGDVILDVLSDLDRVLSTDPHFMMGRWIEDAKARGSTQQVCSNDIFFMV